MRSCGYLSPGASQGIRQLKRHCLFVIFWTITTPNTPDLAPCDIYLFPKLKSPMNGLRFATMKDFAGRAQDYTKKCLSEVLRGLEKALAQVYYIWGGLLWRGQYRYWWINKNIRKKWKFTSFFEQPIYIGIKIDFTFIYRFLRVPIWFVVSVPVGLSSICWHLLLVLLGFEIYSVPAGSKNISKLCQIDERPRGTNITN